MRCKTAVAVVLAVSLAVISLTCNESLPTYVAPQNVLSVTVTSVEQLNDHVAPPGAQMVHVVLTVENIFDDVFFDSVDVKGAMRIWWERKPSRFRTIYLSEKNITDRSVIVDRKLMLLPGHQILLDVYWNLKSDDGVYLPSEMSYGQYLRQQVCGNNLRCSNPETFMIEASLNVYDRVGYVAAPPKEFSFIGKLCDVQGYPPCL